MWKNKNIRMLFLALFTVFSCGGWNASAQEVKKVKIEELASYISNSDHPLVVSFWATWCAPCVHEIPWLQAEVNRQKERGVELILVSLDFREYYPKKISDFIRQKQFSGSFYWLDETNADHFCPKISEKWSGGIPANLFVNNKTGYRKFIGRQLTDRQVEQEIGLLLKEKPEQKSEQ